MGGSENRVLCIFHIDYYLKFSAFVFCACVPGSSIIILLQLLGTFHSGWLSLLVLMRSVGSCQLGAFVATLWGNKNCNITLDTGLDKHAYLL